MARQKNLNIRKTFSALWPPLSPLLYTGYLLYASSKPSIGGNTYSTIKGDILLTPRQLLER